MKNKVDKIILRPLKLIVLYFEHSKDIIAEYNTNLLYFMSIIGFIVVGVLLVSAKLLIPSFIPSVGHILMLVLFFVFIIIGKLITNKECSYETIHRLIILYIFSFFVLVVYINVIPYKSTSVTLITSAMIIVPTIFIIPLHEIFILLLATFIITIHLMNIYTLPNEVGTNTFNLLTGLLFGGVISFLISSLRAKDDSSHRELIRYSNYDALTGVLNKSAVEKNSFTYLETRKEPCVFIIFDIDDFKYVNDSSGHLVGDEVLQILGEYLQHFFRDSDILGRFGGDEFIILIKHLTDESIIEKKLDDFSLAVHDAVYQKNGLDITCSFGGVMLDEDYCDYRDVLTMADKLLYYAKRNGKNNRMIVTPEQYNDINIDAKRMLIIDDEKINRSILSKMFKDDFIVTTVQSGEEALKYLDDGRNTFSVILLDVIMPGMDGFEVIKVIKSNPRIKHIPIVIISADEDAELKMLELGAADMIIKPFDINITKRRVNNALKHWETKE